MCLRVHAVEPLAPIARSWIVVEFEYCMISHENKPWMQRLAKNEANFTCKPEDNFMSSLITAS